MMRRPRIFALLVAGLLLSTAGCVAAFDTDEVLEVDRLGRETIEALRTGGLDSVRPRLAAATRADPDLAAEVAKMRQALPESVPDTVELLSADGTDESGTMVWALAYAVRSGPRTARVDLWVRREGKALVVETIRVTADEGRP